MGSLLRNVQTVYNNVISESSAVIDLNSNKTAQKVEIKAMATSMIRVSTVGHFGPMRV